MARQKTTERGQGHLPYSKRDANLARLKRVFLSVRMSRLGRNKRQKVKAQYREAIKREIREQEALVASAKAALRVFNRPSTAAPIRNGKETVEWFDSTKDCSTTNQLYSWIADVYLCQKLDDDSTWSDDDTSDEDDATDEDETEDETEEEAEEEEAEEEEEDEEEAEEEEAEEENEKDNEEEDMEKDSDEVGAEDAKQVEEEKDMAETAGEEREENEDEEEGKKEEMAEKGEEMEESEVEDGGEIKKTKRGRGRPKKTK